MQIRMNGPVQHETTQKKTPGSGGRVVIGCCCDHGCYMREKQN